jgi:hypothetical protein
MDDLLTISHLNVYAMNPQPMRAIMLMTRGVGADSCGLNEGSRFVDRLATFKSYRTVVDKGARDQRRGAYDVPILTRRKLPSLGTMTLQVSEQVEPSKFAPDRWLTCSMFLHPAVGRVAHVNIHPNALVVHNAKPRPTSEPIVREYVESMESLAAVLSFLREEHFHRVVTGDVNYARNVEPASWAPQSVLRGASMRVRYAGPNDLLAHDRALKLHTFRRIAKQRTKSDHVGFAARLALR